MATASLQRDLDHLDVLALAGQPAAFRDALARAIAAAEEGDALGHRSRAHEVLAQERHRIHAVAGLLLGLAADGGLGVIAVEQPRGGLEQHAVGMAVEVGGQAELPRQQDRVPRLVAQQDRGAVAAVVGLAVLRRPLAVAALDVERGAPQRVPGVRQHLQFAQAHARIAPGILGNRHARRRLDGDAAGQRARALQGQVDAARGLAAVGDGLHDQVGAAHAVARGEHAARPPWRTSRRPAPGRAGRAPGRAGRRADRRSRRP